MVDPRKTLADDVVIPGRGLHTGKPVEVRIRPVGPGEGRFFVRMDLPGEPVIRARAAFVTDTTRSTMLANEGASVRTPEHLLAALARMGVDDARIEITGPEVPILDGSALPWAEAIARVGLSAAYAPRLETVLETPIWVPSNGGAFVAAIPAPELRFSCGIVFDAAPIGEQWASLLASPERFFAEVAPARTFGVLADVEAMQARGLLAGGSLDAAIVCDGTKWLNGPLRFPDEPARHKLLDFMGDLALLDPLPRAHYLAFKAGHALHVRLAQRLSEGG
ncbi:UDP-3-O-acyl-N-acetylglucosamine deacetylase [Polyangium sorediatum]|uniref:UDP-3-O-acyl-N-acetylglucosamine deacetylase n=1 Tax=Polyangium sorediatum TaxID=889274 RepID=A0ABT6NUH0_9BACT|nr:UDP-3-O-acyl-N-acetylglucosamine deacetylase [Polyangium sorediatum]MDI1431959.1 UDP-3-O-acyl-N-acetylglucosamine deacetylase [Polyangium sorediatum]